MQAKGRVMKNGCRTAMVAWASLGAMLLVTLGACRVTVNDLEKWRNRDGSEEKFVEWMLDPEATADVRSKAIEMLFEQYDYGAEFIPRVADLPPDHRDRAILDAGAPQSRRGSGVGCPLNRSPEIPDPLRPA